MKFNLSISVGACMLALLGACGGSDDPKSSAGNGPVAISSANQSDVARASVNGGLSVALVQNAAGSSTVAPGSMLAADRVLQHVLGEAMTRRKGIASASAHPAGTTSSVQACAVSGTIATTWNDHDGDTLLSNGDVLTADFAQCHQSSTLSFNGTLVITLTGTPSAMAFKADAVFQNVTVVHGGVSSTLKGTVSLDEVDTDTISSTTFTVGSGGLEETVSSPSYTDAIVFNAGTVVSSSYLAGTSSLTLNGSFSAQSIGGSVTISTPQPLYQRTGDAFPSSGQVLIAGAGGSKLLASVLDSSQVQLQVDANGDGTYDSTTTVAWSALLP